MLTKQKLHRRNTLVVGLLGVFGLLLVSTLLVSQPVRDRILQDVVVTPGEDEAQVTVLFSDVFRYVTHFPHESSDELRIRLEPVRVAMSDFTAVFQREAVRPLDAADAQLDRFMGEMDDLASAFSLGEEFALTYTFDSKAIDTEPAVELGLYDAVIQAEVEVGSYIADLSPTGLKQISVQNNYLTGRDRYRIDLSGVSGPPAAGLPLAAAVGRIDPILPKDIPDGAFPSWLINLRSGHAIVGAEIVVVVDRMNRG